MKLSLKLPSAAIPYLACALLASGLACGSGDGGTATVDVATLRFILQPGTSGAGVPITASVELLSATGERVASATNQVTLSATGATLGGTTTVAAVAGLATFTGLYFAIAMLTDSTYRDEFLEEVTAELRSVFVVREEYHQLRGE